MAILKVSCDKQWVFMNSGERVVCSYIEQIQLCGSDSWTIIRLRNYTEAAIRFYRRMMRRLWTDNVMKMSLARPTHRENWLLLTENDNPNYLEISWEWGNWNMSWNRNSWRERVAWEGKERLFWKGSRTGETSVKKKTIEVSTCDRMSIYISTNLT